MDHWEAAPTTAWNEMKPKVAWQSAPEPCTTAATAPEAAPSSSSRPPSSSSTSSASTLLPSTTTTTTTTKATTAVGSPSTAPAPSKHKPSSTSIPPSSSSSSPHHITVALPFGVAGDVDEELGVTTGDVHDNMRSIETLNRVYNPEAKYIRYRRVLVDWISEVGEDFGLAISTMHVAVGYLDRILQQVSVAKNRLQLVAMCCILIAAKYEEAEEFVPSVPDLSAYAHHSFKAEVIHQTEVIVLDKLGWMLTVVTPLHFLGYFFRKGIVFHSDSMGGRPLISKVPRYVKKYVDFFADLCQQDYSFQQYTPSLLASAIVLASRKALNIFPVWTKHLEPVLCYEEADLTDCLDAIWVYFKDNFPAQASAASGGASAGPTPSGISEM